MKLNPIMKFLYCLFILIPVSLSAQNEMLEAIRQDKYAAAGNHHTYIVPEGKISDTKPPKGYKPFYFSYYGRHGSRYMIGDPDFISSFCDKFNALHDSGLLTDEGEKLRAWLEWLDKMHDGNMGLLTPGGFQEEKGIAQRCYGRYRRIFRQKDRRNVRFRSSPILRSMLTGTSFSMELQKHEPRLNFDMYAAERYYYTRWDPNPGVDRIKQRVGDSLFRERFDSVAFAGRMFTDTEKSREILGDISGTAYDVIHILGISKCISDSADPYEVFSEEEIFAYAVGQNARTASSFIHSTETGFYRDTNAGSHLIKAIVNKADEAIAGNGICADLVFGHDSGVAPALSFLHTEGYDSCTPLSESYISWPAYKHIYMGCNFAFVFYRNRKGDILVKILENEKETAIPAVPAFEGPYYRWSDLRDWCLR